MIVQSFCLQTSELDGITAVTAQATKSRFIWPRGEPPLKSPKCRTRKAPSHCASKPGLADSQSDECVFLNWQCSTSFAIRVLASLMSVAVQSKSVAFVVKKSVSAHAC